MAWLALASSALWGVLGLGMRSWLHVRRTGRSPLRSGVGPTGWFAVAGVTAAYVAGPVAELGFGVPRLAHGVGLAAGGVVLAVGGLVVLLWAQATMGDSLRIGVDPAERTALITAGPFRVVRNPIYSAMVLSVAGTALLVPNAASIAAAVILTLAEELQVRRVEEPYLTATHGQDYRRYGHRVGRFVPGIGRL